MTTLSGQDYGPSPTPTSFRYVVGPSLPHPTLFHFFQDSVLLKEANKAFKLKKNPDETHLSVQDSFETPEGKNKIAAKV